MKYTITRSRLLFVMTIGDTKHKGLVKVGEVFVDNEVANQGDASKLMKAVRQELGNRSCVAEKFQDYHLEYVECTTFDSIHCYKAQDIHNVLLNSGVAVKYLNKYERKDADIWFCTDSDTVRKAIKAHKEGKKTFNGTDSQVKPRQIVFRPEQLLAINNTVKHFNNTTGKKFLWNAKMRFGKTLSGLEVANQMGYKSTLIVTHRPVVDKGWHEDFEKIFGTKPEYVYATRTEESSEGGDFYQLIKKVDKGEKKLIFFVSMQYLRLSDYVGGKDTDSLKRDIMQYDWELVMVDEAHEGTESTMGARVLERLKKDNTRILSLSGTPFNLLDKYEDGEIYTWDYVMEQKAKQEWDDKHFLDPNPYAELPKMQILTFTLSDMLHEKLGDGNMFKFHEFFRVWTGELKEDSKYFPDGNKPADYKEGNFIHEKAVKDFLNRLAETSDTSLYPFSRPEFRDQFRHSFWILPYVREAAAMEKLLTAHPVFKNFKIVNVAGDGNVEDTKGTALKAVQDAIKKNKYTITLSCGKLTTGVSVPEWTAVLCMKGSENTPAANYMQTIFRVQTHAQLAGRQKSDAYVFDFAPDRALTAVAETAKMAVIAAGGKGSKQLKQSQKQEEEHLQSFLQLCPVISMDGAQMGRHFSAGELFEKLSNVYIERAVRSGYADNSLYNPEALLNLTPEQEQALGDVYDLLGSMPNIWKPDPITVNKQGFDGTKDADAVQYIYFLTNSKERPDTPTCSDELFEETGAPKPCEDYWNGDKQYVGPLFPYCFVSYTVLKNGQWSEYHEPILWKIYEEKTGAKKTDEQKAKEAENKEKRARMSVLRGVSIRIPLLVYGAEINDDNGEEITIDNFTDLVDPVSWEEYMPKGFKKETFNILRDCFDRSIFTGAAKRIRQMVKSADDLSIEDRIDKIATIMAMFHNPDKETVLTPWPVVNKHMSQTVGGWCFFNEEFDGPEMGLNKYNEQVKSVRYVDNGIATHDIFDDYNTRILEINSKTGLYPLYMAYSVFKSAKEKKYREEELTGQRGLRQGDEQYGKQVIDDEVIWEDVLQDNIFVVCRTDMAVSITKRTLAGFKPLRTNVKCYKRDFSINELVTSGVIKKTDESLLLDGKTYYYDGNISQTCDMTTTLSCNKALFISDIVKGDDFWNVYKSLPKKQNEDINNMKFTAVVGNPPYQETTAIKETQNGQKRSKSIFQNFQLAAEDLGHYTSLIYPGGRWIHRSGKGMEDFGLKQINDNSLEKVIFYPDWKELFETADIADGITMVMKDTQKTQYGFDYIYKVGNISKKVRYDKKPKEELLPLNPSDNIIIESIKAIVSKKRFSYLCDSILSQKLFGIESSFVEENPSLVEPYEDGGFFDPETQIKLFTNDKAGKAGRARWYLTNKENITSGTEYLNKWKVIVSSANAGGQKRSNQIAVVDNYSAFGRSRVALKAFDTREEAYNFYRYAQTNFIRFAFLLTDESLTSLAKWVPDIVNYKNDNGILDFSRDLNKQIYKLFEISEPDQEYINSVIAAKDKS